VEEFQVGVNKGFLVSQEFLFDFGYYTSIRENMLNPDHDTEKVKKRL
jgi:hypothetical protein